MSEHSLSLFRDQNKAYLFCVFLDREESTVLIHCILYICFGKMIEGQKAEAKPRTF